MQDINSAWWYREKNKGTPLTKHLKRLLWILYRECQTSYFVWRTVAMWPCMTLSKTVLECSLYKAGKQKRVDRSFHAVLFITIQDRPNLRALSATTSIQLSTPLPIMSTNGPVLPLIRCYQSRDVCICLRLLCPMSRLFCLKNIFYNKLTLLVTPQFFIFIHAYCLQKKTHTQEIKSFYTFFFFNYTFWRNYGCHYKDKLLGKSASVINDLRALLKPETSGSTFR